MSTTDDGGPAFPVPGFNDDPGNPGRSIWPEPGMSLRDWFAGMAMQGLLKLEHFSVLRDGAEVAYRVADAMLKERQK